MTIKDIARESGYSVGTVSRVLNNSPDASEEARKKIMEVVERHNFRLNRYAKQLKQTSSGEILIIVKGSSNMLFASLLESMQHMVEEKGFPCRVNYINEDENEVRKAIRRCDICRPEGIIFLGSYLEYFKEDFGKIEVPCVIATNSAESLSFELLSSVATDDTNAAKEAVEYLIGLGHRNIGILGGITLSSRPVSRRLEGVMKAFEEHGMKFDPDLCYEGARFALSDGYAAMSRLIDKYAAMTAVFAMSDITAIGALRAIRDRGLKVPEDISVFGFDGIELSGYTQPRLTSIRQNREEISKRCVEILCERIGDETLSAVHEMAPYKIMPGESTAKIERVC